MCREEKNSHSQHRGQQLRDQGAEHGRLFGSGDHRTIRLKPFSRNDSSNDFRTGTTIELDGQVWRVVEFLHVKPGKGSAFVRTKLKSAQSGNVVEKTCAGEMVASALLEKSTLQHTYMDGEDYIFMDMSTFEETRLSAKQIGDQRKYLKEGGK